MKNYLILSDGTNCSLFQPMKSFIAKGIIKDEIAKGKYSNHVCKFSTGQDPKRGLVSVLVFLGISIKD